jgi:hypothetical protein
MLPTSSSVAAPSPHSLSPSNHGSTGRRLGGSLVAEGARRPMHEILAEAALRRNQPSLLPQSCGPGNTVETRNLEATIANLALQGCSQSLCPIDRRRRLRSCDKPCDSLGEMDDVDGTRVAQSDSTNVPQSPTTSSRSPTSERSPSSFPTSSWECPRCHFHNHALLYPVCEMCSDEESNDGVDNHQGRWEVLPSSLMFSAIPIVRDVVTIDHADHDDADDDGQVLSLQWTDLGGTGRKSDPIVL